MQRVQAFAQQQALYAAQFRASQPQMGQQQGGAAMGLGS